MSPTIVVGDILFLPCLLVGPSQLGEPVQTGIRARENWSTGTTRPHQTQTSRPEESGKDMESQKGEGQTKITISFQSLWF
ncbi:hypothetical protein DPMN_171110 [Dreissena polymorpha]|uniref:Uncharacterized protein n=1 Tax=Dreissena polymorpha TaxID=45954 RepID=A0A9D4DZR8_DREPO|nr:hypothetical protein DPMN_171056 [Dreissena polymorpha]KAH3769833.1 hypothetical protein DPMN_171110 [Dreissena polymorpha]